jgi:hypothetical protein
MRHAIIAALLATFAIAALARTEAEACFTKRQVTNSETTLVKVVRVERTCGDEAEERNIFPYGTRDVFLAEAGMQCHYIDANGATRCDSYGAFEKYPLGDEFSPCKVVAYSTLTDLGCCQTPCPPSFPDCHAN